MHTTDLVRYLADTAGDLIAEAEATAPATAQACLNEAEELLTLGASILDRRTAKVAIREAALSTLQNRHY